jgi:hypothetical protein
MRGQELTIEQAFRALTIEGAYATFEEERKGSLAVGKLADMVILSADPFSVPIDEVPTIQVVATIIGGHVEYCAAGQESVCAGGAPPPPSQSSAALSFAGTWTGADADDGSQITLTISQAGNKLTAQFADSYSGTLEPPGYVGEGSGRATAAAAAALDFHLERHDGSTVNVTATLTLSADGQALTLAFPGSMPAELRR